MMKTGITIIMKTALIGPCVIKPHCYLSSCIPLVLKKNIKNDTGQPHIILSAMYSEHAYIRRVEQMRPRDCQVTKICQDSQCTANMI